MYYYYFDNINIFGYAFFFLLALKSFLGDLEISWWSRHRWQENGDQIWFQIIYLIKCSLDS
jgi:hypothetical protein